MMKVHPHPLEWLGHNYDVVVVLQIRIVARSGTLTWLSRSLAGELPLSYARPAADG